MEKFFDLPYQILDHKAQIRATVIDRRPILGIHPKNNRLFILNGLGTRGVLMAPLLSHWLYEFIEKQYEFPIEVSIKRFEKKYYNALLIIHFDARFRKFRGFIWRGGFISESFSFRIAKGDRIGLIGKNGAGKSTLLKILSGENSPSNGNFTIEKNCSIGYLPQGASS